MRFESILVDVDATAAVHPELDRAARLARRCGASLTIVDSMTASAQGAHSLPATIEEDGVADRRDQLERLAGRVTDVRTASHLLVGEAAVVLIRQVLRSKHDLLVRSHARDLTAVSDRDGAVNEELLRKCPCPVLLVGPGRAADKPLIVGVVTASKDDSPPDPVAAKVAALTVALAQLEDGAPMLLLTWAPFAEQMIRANALEDRFTSYVEAVRQRTTTGLAALTQSIDLTEMRTVMRRGKPEDIIPAFTIAQGIDLVVMAVPISNDTITGFLFGGPSPRFLRRLVCSLLAVKPDGFVSPIRAPSA